MKRVAITLTLLWPLSGHADELPCPPKFYFCWQAKVVFNKFGTPRAVAKAKACGWTSQEIAEAMKCR